MSVTKGGVTNTIKEKLDFEDAVVGRLGVDISIPIFQ
ncbi:hypothetical protein MHK_007610 [Candidatus Magnetomorum sp. HK-1]|nr:hypothetical protein MHK_007610 [Candidatus Magnetomorum sp. HK-1]